MRFFDPLPPGSVPGATTVPAASVPAAVTPPAELRPGTSPAEAPAERGVTREKPEGEEQP
jgi:hypothetical protein